MITVKEVTVEVEAVVGAASSIGLQWSSHEVQSDHCVSWQCRGHFLWQASSRAGSSIPRQRQWGTTRPTTSEIVLYMTQMASLRLTPGPQLEV